MGISVSPISSTLRTSPRRVSGWLMCNLENSEQLQFLTGSWTDHNICVPPPSALLTQVIDGKLAPFLSKVIKFASSHVFSCSLCREKGFICELCQNGQVIYPFQESATKRYTSSHELLLNETQAQRLLRPFDLLRSEMAWFQRENLVKISTHCSDRCQ